MLRMTLVLCGALGLAALAWIARDGVLFLGGAMLSLVALLGVAVEAWRSRGRRTVLGGMPIAWAHTHAT